MLRSKLCQGVKCVEKESELGCKVYYATLKQIVPKEQSVLGSKVWVSLNHKIIQFLITDHSVKKKESIMDIKPDRIMLKTILILISFGGFIIQIELQ